MLVIKYQLDGAHNALDLPIRHSRVLLRAMSVLYELVLVLGVGGTARKDVVFALKGSTGDNNQPTKQTNH